MRNSWPGLAPGTSSPVLLPSPPTLLPALALKDLLVALKCPLSKGHNEFLSLEPEGLHHGPRAIYVMNKAQIYFCA